MKNYLLKSVCLLTCTLLYFNIAAQVRFRSPYGSESSNQDRLQKNGPESLFTSSLHGYYSEGFESTFPPAGWQIVDELDTTNTWTSSNVAELPASYEGTQSAHCKYAYPGPTGIDWLITPKFKVAQGDSLSFFFKLEYAGYIPDSTFILISTTDSAITSFTSIVDFYAEGYNYPTDATNWYYKTYSLNSFAGQDIYVAFKNTNTLGDGIFIDNVEMGTRPQAQAALLSINVDDFYPAGISIPTATVKNKGSITQNINVTLNITDGYSSTKSIMLAPLASSKVNFDPWSAEIGSYTLHAQTSLEGDSILMDDTLLAQTRVLEPFLHYGWSTHDPLNVPTVGGAAASICTSGNSRYFLFGGNKNPNIFIGDAYEYDLSFGTWASINPMPVPVSYAASGSGNGKIIVAGGEGVGGVKSVTQIYDYTSGTWSVGTTMNTAVTNMAFGMYKDSLLYLIGGRKINGAFTNLVQMYNIYTDTWTSCTPNPEGMISGLRGGISGNKIVITGGYNAVLGKSINTTYIGEIDSLNPSVITWTPGPDFPLNSIRFAGAAVSLDKHSDLIIFSGGSSSDVFNDVTDKTFAFDVSTNTWKLGPDKPTASHYFSLTPVVQNDSLYLAALGGGDGNIQIDKNEWLNLGRYQFPTSTVESQNISGITLYPNPAEDETTLSLNLQHKAQVSINIIDVMGHLLENVCDRKIEAGNSIYAIHTDHILPGVYFCAINVDGKSLTKKIVKF